MSRSLRRAVWLGLACVGLIFGDNSAVAQDTVNPAADDADKVFDLTRVWKIHLRVTADNWKAMQPTRGGMPGFGPPPPNAGGPSPPEQKSGTPAPVPPPPGPGAPGVPGAAPPPFRPGSFGYEFDYVKADVELDGEALEDVGLRFKGNGTYMVSAAGHKRPFKIDFNRFVEDQRFHGLQQLNLHNNVMDPTHLRQALSYPVFQAAGVPAPRTAFAEVRLTIEGETEGELLGLYTLVEEVDKAFLRRHFKSSKGLLLKPEGTQGLEYRGDDWSSYEWYEPKSKVKKSEARRLIETLRVIHKADDEQFRNEIGNYLDLDEFARFLAANTLLSNMDSFLTHVHNYYLYLPPETDRLVILPWDMDLSLGAFFFAGTPEQLQELSISHPHQGNNKLLDRILAWDDFQKTYRNHLRQLTETCFSETGLTTRSIPIARAAIQDLVAEENRQSATAQANRPPGGFGGPGMFATAPTLEVFLTKRRESVLAQLAGKSKGRVPGMAFGPGMGGPPGSGPGGPGPGAFGPGNFHGEQILRAADADKSGKLTREELRDLGAKWLQTWDKDQSQTLNGDEVAAGLNDALGPPPNAPGGFKLPAGFGPGRFLGPPMMKAADADGDGLITDKEWTMLMETWFRNWDTNKDDELESSEVIAGLNKAFGPPPGLGPPAANPPRARTDSR